MESLVDKISKKTELTQDQATEVAELMIQHLKQHTQEEFHEELEKVFGIASDKNYDDMLNTRFGTLKVRMSIMKADMDEFFRNRKSKFHHLKVQPLI